MTYTTRLSDALSRAGRPFFRLFAATLLMAVTAGAATAQTQKVTDGSTPSALTPGAPAGSYSLSGFETVNPYNGGLNFSLPLLTVGGRGGAGYAVTLRIDQKWVIRKQLNPGEPATYYPTPSWYGEDSDQIEQTYSVGKIISRAANSRDYITTGNCGYVHRLTLTRLNFVAPDGTEYELRDTAQNGAAHLTDSATCQSGQYFDRGRVFVTADGSSATFIADSDVTDYPYDDPPNNGSAGYLILKDGTRFRVGDPGSPPGVINWMRDRNGNLVTFGYGTDQKLATVTDSLGRAITISNASPVTITYKGFGGADRTITINIASLSTATLRSGFQIRTQSSLFPGINNPVGSLNSTPQIISSVVLPNGKSYQFSYNDYAELARVVLPTGGAVEYDYVAGLTDGNASGMLTDANGEKQVYRRVVERRVYPDGGMGSGYSVKQTYSRPESSTFNAGYVDVQQCTSGPSVGQCDAGAALLGSERHYYYGSPRLSFNRKPTDYTGWQEGKEYRSEVYDPQSGALLRSMDTTWQQPVDGATWPLTQPETNGAARANNPQVTQVLTTLADTSQVSGQTFSYDQYGNRTDAYEYDFGAAGSGTTGAFIRRTHTDYVTTAAYINATVDASAGASLRGLPSQQWVSTDTAGSNKVSLAVYNYDQYGLADCPNIVGHDTAFTTGFTTRGNVTSVTGYADAASGTGAVTSTSNYDIAGNVVSTTDPLGNTTTVSFADSFCNDNGVRCGEGYTPHTYALLASVTTPVPDASTTYNYTAGTFGSTSAFTTSTIYDYYTGLVYSTTDANGQTTTLSYKDAQGNLDPLDRLTSVVRPDGSRTDIDYGDTVGNIYVHSLADLDSARRTESYRYFDGLGRAVRSQQYENSDTSHPWVTADTEYDALGRVKRVSFPYRWSAGISSSFSTNKWAETVYDALGRVKTVTTQPDAATVTTAYSGDKVLVTDQAGKQRMSRSDALGRLTDVWEVTPADPSTETVVFQGVNYTGYHTVYGYDVLGNLRTVTQAGQQNGQQVTEQRSFVYDSLSRLTSATNPESGTVSYTYDNNGNLQAKTDARGVAAAYSYDHLNRNIIITYATTGTTSAATPNVYRYYDSAPNGLGRLYRSEAEAVAQTTFTAYDVMGRPTDCQQKFWVSGAWGQPYDVHQDYNLAGAVISERYPSQHTVNYSYDAAGRLGDNSGTGQSAFSGNLGDSVQRTYSSSVLYDPLGGMNQERFGTDTPVYNKHFYNVRGQLNEIRVSTYAFTDAANYMNWNRGAILNVYSAAPSDGWTASGPDNNGNLRKQMIYLPNDDAVSGYAQLIDNFGYDALNRLTWYDDKYNNTTPISHQAYNYDRWGNRTIDAGNATNAPAPQFTVDAANRLGVPAGQSGAMTYDAAGNLTNDTYQGGQGGGGTRAYDAENRMTSAQYASGQLQTAAYAYDADGRRIKRNVGTAGEVWQVYGMGGELLAEYAANASPNSPQKEYGYRGGELLVTAAATGGWGAAPVIHDNPLVAGQTTVQSRHITELRSAIDALRSHLGLAGYPWNTSASVGALIKADPIVEMRTALDQALGAPSGGYSVGLAQGQPIKAVHLQELRDRVLAAWQGGTVGVDLRWLVGDQLGTPRMVVDKTGSLSGVRRHDYFPFGEEIGADATWRTSARGYGVGDGVRQRFTNKERDVETSLDYFGARYYSSTQGRFNAPDTFGGSIFSPQTLNKYSYVKGNPLNLVDLNGRWPTSIHSQIIDEALQGLTDDERNQMKVASENLDFPIPGQFAAWSFEHNMRAPDQTINEAASLSDDFIFQNERLAQSEQKSYEENGGGGLSPDAAYHFGEALHTVTDGTSPTHEGHQVWMGIVPLKEVADYLITGDATPLDIFITMDTVHSQGETTKEFLPRKDAIIAKVQQEFGKTFGPRLLNMATTPRISAPRGLTSLDLLRLYSKVDNTVKGLDFGVVTVRVKRGTELGDVLEQQQ